MTSEEDTDAMDDGERELVEAAKDLLWKIVRSNLLRQPRQLTAVARLIEVLEELPDLSDLEAALKVVLAGPETISPDGGKGALSWTIEASDLAVCISAAGWTWCPSAGGDSFTLFEFTLLPGLPGKERYSFLEDWMIENALAFPGDVRELDLSEEGYGVDVYVDGWDVMEEE